MLNNKLRRERNRDLASRMIRKSGDRFSGQIMCLERPAMVEKAIMSSRNVIDLSRYRERNAATRAPAPSDCSTARKVWRISRGRRRVVAAAAAIVEEVSGTVLMMFAFMFVFVSVVVVVVKILRSKGKTFSSIEFVAVVN